MGSNAGLVATLATRSSSRVVPSSVSGLSSGPLPGASTEGGREFSRLLADHQEAAPAPQRHPVPSAANPPAARPCASPAATASVAEPPAVPTEAHTTPAEPADADADGTADNNPTAASPATHVARSPGRARAHDIASGRHLSTDHGEPSEPAARDARDLKDPPASAQSSAVDPALLAAGVPLPAPVPATLPTAQPPSMTPAASAAATTVPLPGTPRPNEATTTATATATASASASTQAATVGGSDAAALPVSWSGPAGAAIAGTLAKGASADKGVAADVDDVAALPGQTVSATLAERGREADLTAGRLPGGAALTLDARHFGASVPDPALAALAALPSGAGVRPTSERSVRLAEDSLSAAAGVNALGVPTAWRPISEAPVAPPATASVDTPLTDPGFHAALGVQVSLLARDGIQQAELRLNPADMGPVSVQITMNGDQARVDFGADLAKTREVIEAGWAELAASLQEAGFTLSGGGVSQHARERHAPEGRPAGLPGRSGRAEAGDVAAVPSVSLTRPRAGAALDLYA